MPVFLPTLRVMPSSAGLAAPPWATSAESVYVNDPAEPTRASSFPSALSMTTVSGTLLVVVQFVSINAGASTVTLYVHTPLASTGESLTICAGVLLAAFPKSTHAYGVVEVRCKMSYGPEIRSWILDPLGPAPGCEPCEEKPDGGSAKLYEVCAAALFAATAAALLAA